MATRCPPLTERAGNGGGVARRPKVFDVARGTISAGTVSRSPAGRRCSRSGALATGIAAAGCVPETVRELVCARVWSRAGRLEAAREAGGPSSNFQPAFSPAGCGCARTGAAREAGPAATAWRFTWAGSAGGGCVGYWLWARLTGCFVALQMLAEEGAAWRPGARRTVNGDSARPREPSDARLELLQGADEGEAGRGNR